jgi:hypothetical protein
MSYKSFTFQELKDRFKLDLSLSPILSSTKVIPLEPSPWLWRALEISSNSAVTTAKERSERIISPILLDSREKNNRQFSIFSGWSFDVDVSQGLHGECDFLLSGVPFDFEIKVPFFAVRETKGGEIESCLPHKWWRLSYLTNANKIQYLPYLAASLLALRGGFLN